jgi:hypothetical protein
MMKSSYTRSTGGDVMEFVVLKSLIMDTLKGHLIVRLAKTIFGGVSI